MSMDLPTDIFLADVAGDESLVRFRYGFTLDEKALDTPTVTEEANGDLTIAGYAAVFEGMDRENENFAPGAFTRGIKSFLKGQAGLMYHHKHDKQMGKVLELREDPKGLWMKARVDGATQTHPELGTYYQQVKNGSLNALSVGGFFKRKLTEMGKKIVDMDFTEISMTPVPVHPGTKFAVVGGKALTSDLTLPESVKGNDLGDHEIREEDLWQIQDALNTLGRFYDNMEKRKASETAVV